MDLIIEDLGRIFRSYGRVEIFSKIVGVKDGKLDITRRWMLVKDFYDEIWIEEDVDVERNVLKMEFLSMEDNNLLINKVFGAMKGYFYQKLKNEFGGELSLFELYEDGKLEYSKFIEKLSEFKENFNSSFVEYLENYKRLVEFCKKYKIVINGRMPKYLFGKYSSQAAKIMTMLNEILKINLPLKVLRDIVSKINGTLKFFVSSRDSANIRGIEKSVEKVDEESLDLKIYWQEFKNGMLNDLLDRKRLSFEEINVDMDFVNEITLKKSKDILLEYEGESLNDFYLDILELYPELKSKVGFISGFYPIVFKLR